MSAGLREHDERRARIALLTCACLMGVAAVALASPPDHPGRDPGSAPAAAGAGSGEVHAAADVARRFFDDYLAWLAGRRTAGRIRGANRLLRERLASDHVRPSRVARRRRAAHRRAAHPTDRTEHRSRGRPRP